MKKLIFIAAFLWLNYVNAQSVDWSPLVFNEEGKLEMVEVVEVDSKDASEIYNQVKFWFSSYYNSLNDVIQLDDKDAGTIKGRAIASFYAKTMGKLFEHKVYYTIQIDIKDGKYRLLLSDYILQNDYGDSPLENQFTDKYAVKKNGSIRDFSIAMKEGVESHWLELKTSLSDKVKESSDDDW